MTWTSTLWDMRLLRRGHLRAKNDRRSVIHLCWIHAQFPRSCQSLRLCRLAASSASSSPSARAAEADALATAEAAFRLFTSSYEQGASLYSRQREAQAAKREETEREYKARLDPVRAENERMTAKAREHGLV